MVGFPRLPDIKSPIAAESESRSAEFAVSSAMANDISYIQGIPVYYSVSKDGGGTPFERKQMNRLLYDSTVGLFRGQIGFFQTFNDKVCESIGGYPKGAVLKWFRFSRIDGGEIPSEAAPNLMGEVVELQYDDTYEKGVVGTFDDKLYVVIESVKDLDYYEFQKRIREIKFDGIAEVVSSEGDNKNDFRSSGPTEQNGWKILEEPELGYFPSPFDLMSEDSVLFKKSATGRIVKDGLLVNRDGWLLVTCKRQSPTLKTNTLGQYVKNSLDGITARVFSRIASKPIVTIEKQFNTMETVEAMIPVNEGNSVSIDVRNDVGSQISVVARLAGRS